MPDSQPIASSADSLRSSSPTFTSLRSSSSSPTLTSLPSSSPTFTSSPSSAYLSTFPQHPRQTTAAYSDSILSDGSKRRVRFTFGYDDEPDNQSSSDGTPPPLPLPESGSAKTRSSQQQVPLWSKPTPSMHIISPSTYDSLITATNSSTLDDNNTPKYELGTSPIMTITNNDTSLVTTEDIINCASSAFPTADHHPSLLPSPSDLVSTIPIRTSSMTSSSSYISSFQPLTSPRNSSEIPASSRCSSMNSAVSSNWSLDHRTMHRAPTPSSSRKSPRSSAEKSLPALPLHTSDSRLAQRRPSATERSAFLSSAPVRSTITKSSKPHSLSHYHQQSFARSTPSLPARFRNMSPVSSSTALATVSSPTLSLSTFSALHLPLTPSRPTKHIVPLEKRRWSNDSTRGIHGLAFLEGSDVEGSVGSSTFLDDDEFDEDGSDINDSYYKKAHSVHGYNSYTKKKLPAKPKKIKRKCVVLSAIESLIKK